AIGNSNIPVEMLIKLYKNRDENIREGVADNLNTPAEILVELAADKNDDVKAGVAYNSNAPAEALIVLSKDKDLGIRIGVANNPNTPAEILVELAADVDINVRTSIAYNPNTPAEMREQLTTGSALEEFEETENVLFDHPNVITFLDLFPDIQLRQWHRNANTEASISFPAGSNALYNLISCALFFINALGSAVMLYVFVDSTINNFPGLATITTCDRIEIRKIETFNFWVSVRARTKVRYEVFPGGTEDLFNHLFLLRQYE
ncbi:hypothetical protein LCGC14_3069250, partial [marine sediment metagenome]